MYQVTLPEGTTKQQIIEAFKDKKFMNRARKKKYVPSSWIYAVAGLPTEMFEQLLYTYSKDIRVCSVFPDDNETIFAMFISPKSYEQLMNDGATFAHK